MLSRINPNIIDANNIHLELMTTNELQNVMFTKFFDNFDTAYYMQKADEFAENNPIPPYSNTNILLQNNTTNAFDRRNNNITDKTFNDCVEIAIRHFMNLVLYNPETKQFDLSIIKEYVKINDPNNLIFLNFVDFYENDQNPLIQLLLKNNEVYKKQTPDRVENGSQATRSAWNMAMGDLNVGVIDVNSNKIKYFKRDPSEYEYELKPGFINFILVCQKVFGLKFEHGEFDPSKSSEDNLEWLKTSFETLFNALTVKKNMTVQNKKRFVADFSRLQFVDANSDFFGAIKITVYQNNNFMFSFTINASENHAYVSQLIKPKTTISLPFYMDYGVRPETAEEVLWLLSVNKTNDNTKDRAKHLFYKLFDKELKENSPKIEVLEKIIKKDDVNDPFYSAPAFKAIVENIVSRLNLEDPQALQRAAPLLLKLNELKLVGSDSIRKVNVGGDYTRIIWQLDDKSDKVMDFIRLAMKSNNSTFKKDPLRDLIIYQSDYDPTQSSTQALKTILKNLSFNKGEDFIWASQSFVKLLNSPNKDHITALKLFLLETNMEEIDFKGTNLGSHAYATSLLCRILEVNNPTLITLDLSNNKIYNHNVKLLAEALKENKVLTTLDLHYNYIKEEGVMALIELRKTNTTLKFVNISQNPYNTDKKKREELIEEFRHAWDIPEDEEIEYSPEGCCVQ